MAGTLDDKQTEEARAAEAAASVSPEGATAAPPPAPETLPSAPDDASRLCANCAALLAEGQDWCLECGIAQPGRIGSKPGWRPALTVVLLTTILAAGAVAAAYAALSSDAERQASASAPPSAAPVVPPAPVQTTPAPADTTPEVAAPQDDADAPAPEAPEPDSSDSSSPSSSSPPAVDPGGSGGDTGGGSGSDPAGDDDGTQDEPRPKPAIVALAPDAASTYDPFDRAGGLTGDPADAIDGRRRTKWEAPVGEDGLVNIGLLISLEKAQAFEKVRVQAGTPGFTVVLYGSKRGTAPEGDPAQTAAWEKLDETRDFGTDEKLGMGEGKWRYVLLWFTEQPADTKVMIPEVALLRK